MKLKPGALRSKLVAARLNVQYIRSSGEDYKHVNLEDKKVIFFLSADYGNIGDVAISYAQKKILQEQYPDRVYIEVPLSETLTAIKSLKKKVTPRDVITIVGGGNTGDRYDYIENRRRLVIKKFPNNKIVCFPQTLDFSETKNGRKELERSRQIYSKHANLTIMVREERSFSILEKGFETKNLLTPDIVLSLDESRSQGRDPSTVVFCIREDAETNIDDSEKKRLVKYFESRYEKTIFRDTHVGEINLSNEEGLNLMQSIWETFRSSTLVVTDRLHGMIFCAITKTPCIAINNSNGKVAGVYDLWIKRLGGVVLLKDFSEESMQAAIDTLDTTKPGGTGILAEEFDVIRTHLT